MIEILWTIDSFCQQDIDRARGFVADLYLSSWNARVLDSGSVPYRLGFLTTVQIDRQAVRRVAKLVSEANALVVTRLHLYVLLSSTGALGNLLPSSPSFLAGETFQPPEGLTDIWLDGGIGYLQVDS